MGNIKKTTSRKMQPIEKTFGKTRPHFLRSCTSTAKLALASMGPYAFTMLFALITITYCVTLLRLLPPFSPAVFFGGAIGLFFCLPFQLKDKSYLIPLILGVFLLICFILIPILGGTARDLLVFCWIFVVSVAFGGKILSAIVKNGRLLFLERFIITTVLGLGSLSLMLLCLAALHVIYVKILYLVMILLSLVCLISPVRLKATLISWIKIWRNPQESFLATQIVSMSPFVAATISVVLVMMLVNFIGALCPETSFDGLNYHLTVPKLYLINHGLINLPNIVQSYFAKSIQMLYLLGLSLSGQITVKLFSLVFGVLTMCSLVCLGKRFFSLEVGLLGAALFYLCPLVGFTSIRAYNDLASCFYVVTTVLIFLIWQENRRRSFLLLCGILSAFTLAIKLYNLLPLFFMGLMIIYLNWQHTKNKRTEFWINIALFATPALLLSLPWMLVTYKQTGNPIFPFFNAVFKSPLLPATNSFMDLKFFGMGNKLKDFFYLPWNITYRSYMFGGEADGGLGAVLLTSLPILAFMRKSRVISLMVLISTGSIISYLFITQYARYLLPEIAILSLFTAYLFYYSLNHSSRAFQKTLYVSLLAYLLFATFVYLNTLNAVGKEQLKMAIGKETQQQYLTKLLSTYPATQYLNEHYGAKDRLKVFLLAFSDRYHLEFTAYDILSPNMFDFPDYGSGHIANYLRQKGMTHVLVPIIEGRQNKVSVMVRDFVSDGAQIEFHAKNVRLYRLVPTGAIPNTNTAFK